MILLWNSVMQLKRRSFHRHHPYQNILQPNGKRHQVLLRCHTVELIELCSAMSACSMHLFSADSGSDEVRIALERLIGHISNPRKFKKASPLLRQLLKENKVTSDHSALLFQVTLVSSLPSILNDCFLPDCCTGLCRSIGYHNATVSQGNVLLRVY